MADRKARSVTFKLPHKISVGVLKDAIEEECGAGITVFQDIGNDEYLVELESKDGTDLLIEDGFDVEEVHVGCHPPHGCYTNVSILGLRSYVKDVEVEHSLIQYGEINSNVIRLKYKADHELAGIENGNRLVRMVLTTKSIPYSLKIGGEWCLIIHNNQQPVCSECNETGHTRKRCPEIECRICKQKGHMSYVCDQQTNDRDQQTNECDQETNERDQQTNECDQETTERDQQTNQQFKADDSVHELGSTENTLTDRESPESEKTQNKSREDEELDMEIQQEQGKKRPHSTDSDSEPKTPSRRQKYHPVPNMGNTRLRNKNSAKEQFAS